MGMILNRFDMLQMVQNALNDSSSYYSEKLKNVQLTAVLVHNPHDMKFREWIQNNYVRMARMTGKNFLFITFVPPSEEYKCGIGREDYNLDPIKLYGDNSMKIESEETSINLLRLLFNINTEDSFIVLTKNLNDKTADVIKTNTDQIREQFDLITDFCDKVSNNSGNRQDDYTNLIIRLNTTKITLEKELITIITDILSIVSRRDGDIRGLDLYKQKEHLRGALERIRLKVLAINTEDDDRYEEVSSIITDIYDEFLQDNQEKRRNYQNMCYYRNYRNYPELEDVSSKAYKSFQILKRIFEDKAHFDENLDHAALVLYVAKIFEIELNSSYVQFIRKKHHIPMPRYYNRYCCKVGEVEIQSGREYVNINQVVGPGRLKQIELGKLTYMLESPEMPPGLIGDGLLHVLNRLKNIRNEKIHTLAADFNDVEETSFYLDQFIHNFMDDIYQLKSRLRNPCQLLNE